MLTLHGLDAPFPEGPPVYATLGMFDGVHLGHRRVLGTLCEWAEASSGRAAVLTFRRHPHEVLQGRNPACLTSLRHRLELFAEAGLDVAVVLSFTDELASLDPGAFVRRVLVEWMAVRGVVMGYDQRFGRGGAGDAERMARLGARFGFEVRQVPPVHVGGAVVSSTAIRRAIRDGDLDAAAAMLGRPVSVLGRVVHGQGKGRGLGCPTANLDLRHELHLPEGVYAAVAYLDGREIPAVTNIGRRPSFSPGGPEYVDESPVVEVHLLGFSGDIYGRDIEVRFVRKLREERRFDSPGALSEQITRDVETAKDCFAGR